MMQTGIEDVFKAIVDAKWGVMSSGEVEAPTGLFTIVEIPKTDGERAEMREAVFPDVTSGIFDNMESGWYFVIQYSKPSLEYYQCKNRDFAFSRYALAQSAYEAWADT